MVIVDIPPTGHVSARFFEDGVEESSPLLFHISARFLEDDAEESLPPLFRHRPSFFRIHSIPFRLYYTARNYVNARKPRGKAKKRKENTLCCIAAKIIYDAVITRHHFMPMVRKATLSAQEKQKDTFNNMHATKTIHKNSNWAHSIEKGGFLFYFMIFFF